MRFLCDLQISDKLVNYLNYEGFETIHISEILN